jgi:thioesterase domain-containing protein
MAVQMLLEVEKIVGHSIPDSILVDHPTIAQLADELNASGVSRARPFIQIQPGTDRPPLFFFHGDYDGGYYARRVARLLGPDQPFISVAPHGLGSERIPDSIEAMAADRLRPIIEAYPTGPFRLAGYCNGGMVALSVANLLVRSGRDVDSVFLIDAPTLNFRPGARRLFQSVTQRFDAISPEWETRAPPLAAAFDLIWRQAANLQVYRRDPHLVRHAIEKLVRPRRRASKFVRPDLAKLPAEMRQRERAMAKIYNRLFRKYIPEKTNLSVVYFAAENDGNHVRHLGPNVEVVNVPGGHWGCITTHVDSLAHELAVRLQALDGISKALLSV